MEDLKEEFIQKYIYPTLQAGAVYENKYLLGTSFARPIIAKKIQVFLLLCPNHKSFDKNLSFTLEDRTLIGYNICDNFNNYYFWQY